MRAAAWNDRSRIEVSDIAAPQPVAQEALVAVSACGICGSDLHVYNRHAPARPGLVPGHEIAGVVVEAPTLKAGVAVAIEPLLACGGCVSCSSGRPMLCPGRRLLGAAAPGGLQELLTVPERHLFALPDGVEPALGALAEPLAVALRGVDLAALVPGMKVAVLGAGTIGLAALLLSRQAAAEVAVTARYGHQAELVRSFGGTAIPADDNARRALSAFAPDVVIETVGGAGETLTEALEVVRPGGTVVALGVFTGRPEVPALKIVLREVTLVGSLMYGTHSGRSEFGAAVALLPRLAPELERLQTHWFELEQAPSAFATAADKASGAVKVTLRVGA